MKNYIIVNNYHDEISEYFNNSDLTSVKKELFKTLSDYSKQFDDEIEEDYLLYYDNYEQAQKANSDNIYNAFVNETEIYEFNNNTDIYEIDIAQLYLDSSLKFNRYMLSDLK